YRISSVSSVWAAKIFLRFQNIPQPIGLLLRHSFARFLGWWQATQAWRLCPLRFVVGLHYFFKELLYAKSKVPPQRRRKRQKNHAHHAGHNSGKQKGFRTGEFAG